MAQLTVMEASGAYERAMRNVQPVGPGICATCHTFIDSSYDRCYPCVCQPDDLDVVVPITYSVNLGQMHLALRNYKDGIGTSRNYALPRVAAILWRFIDAHEPCVARAAGIRAFDLVTTVPSSRPERDENSSLRTIVSWCRPISDRTERVLVATGKAPPGRAYDPARYQATRVLDGARVLLIDDTWTAGGHAQSAGRVLRQAGAAAVALVVIGRHVTPEWIVGDKPCRELVAELPPFDWGICAAQR